MYAAKWIALPVAGRGFGFRREMKFPLGLTYFSSLNLLSAHVYALLGGYSEYDLR